MARTEQQKAADAAVEAALALVVDAYGLVNTSDGIPAVLVRYYVVMAHRKMTVDDLANDTEGQVMYNWTCDGNGMPWHELIGMADIGKTLIRATMATAREDDD